MANEGTACESDEQEAEVLSAGLRDALEDVRFDDYVDAGRGAAVCGTITDDYIYVQVTGREAAIVDAGENDKIE